MTMKTAVLLFILLIAIHECVANRCAYVTHLDTMGDEGRLKGAIALGGSLLRTQTRKDKILLVSNPVSSDDARLLQYAGWNVMAVAEIDAPKDKGYYHPSTRFSMTKIELFDMTEYDKLIYMDPYMTVSQNIDNLCEVPAEFAAVVHDGVFDTSLMVVRPSIKTYSVMMDMMSLSKDEYKGLDNGFFNLVYWNVNYCPYIDPVFNNEENNETVCARLPLRYNGNVMRYSIYGEWTAEPNSAANNPVVINYMLTYDILPWNWVISLFVDEYKQWWNELIFSYYIYDRLWLALSYVWRQVALILFFWCEDGYRSIKRIYEKQYESNSNYGLVHPYFRVLWTTFVSWLLFVISILFSEFDTMNPIFNIIIFIQLMQISMEVSLFSIIGDKDMRYVLRRVYPLSLSTLLLSIFYVSSISFFSRIFLVSFYAITVHFITFTYISARGPVAECRRDII
jgi:hypothetical protein